MIENIKLNNFTTFNVLDMRLSPKINIIIGENGTGKTHLMKAMYGLLKTSGSLEKNTKKCFQEAVTEKLIRLFTPEENTINQLWRHESKDKSQVEVGFNGGKNIKIEFNYNSRNADVTNFDIYENSPVFIPTKEVISLLKGFLLYSKAPEIMNALFDDTYIDLCKSLTKPIESSIEEKFKDPRFGTSYPKIVDSISGYYEINPPSCLFHSGRYAEENKKFGSQYAQFYSDTTEFKFKKSDNRHISATMTAEGFKKIGIIQHLLLNGELSPAKCGVLFWDEPESNLNPILMNVIVDALLELSRNGLQIVLATHDYTTLKWFDLLKDEKKEDHIRYHSLYFDPKNKETKLSSTDEYLEITQNSISETFNEIMSYEISKKLGGLE